MSIVKGFINRGTRDYEDESLMVFLGMAGTEFAEGRGQFFSALAEHPKVMRAV
ncbi:hypothetical protein CI610_00261 [invertebrate metagenome]|uniref:Uncharacterized protein n=1 Tax=invertebrate metagenome TaxID=1711999 RepID=A0A2H9TC50_9ZZZZ